MAHKSRPKSDDVKQPAPLAPRIGEYVLKASEVAKLSKTLQERIVVIADAIEDYTKYKNDCEDYDHRKGLKLWEALFDAKDELVKTILDTWGTITGLYDVIKSPPPEFEKVAASLVVVVSVIKGLRKIPDLGIERTCRSCWRLLHTANSRLDAAISELQWYLFHFVPSAIPDDENSNGESSLADMHNDCVAVIDAQQGLVLDEVYRNGWQHALNALREKDPDAPEWEDITSDSDESLMEEAGSRYLERTGQEQFNAKTDENYRQLLEAIVAAMPAVEPRPGETKEALAKRKDTFERIVGYIAEMAGGVDIERTIAIIDSGNGVKERLLALSQLPLFGNIMDAPNRVIARLLKCSHTHVGDEKKELQTEIAKAKVADEDMAPTDSGNLHKWDANEDDDNDPTDVAADKLTFVGKDSVRKGQRASKLSPTDRAADRADAAKDRKTNEWIAKHGG